MKYHFNFDNLEARVLHTMDNYYLSVYEGDKLIYDYPVCLYSLKDCGTVVRSRFNKKGMRINWIEVKE